MGLPEKEILEVGASHICKGDGHREPDGDLSDVATISESDGVTDLGDLLLFSIGESLARFRKISGCDSAVVSFDGGEISIEDQDPGQRWRDRLNGLLFAVRSAHEAGVASDMDSACEAVLRADGWTWTGFTFRTPVWMDDHDEVCHSDAIEEFKELKWLEKYSSVTR